MAAVDGQVISIHSADQFKAQLQNGTAANKLVVVDFTASWCPPCRFIAPVFVEFAKKYAHVIFLKVDVDEVKDVAEEWKVEAMPTFVFIKEGKQVHRLVGASKDELEKNVIEHSTAVVGANRDELDKNVVEHSTADASA